MVLGVEYVGEDADLGEPALPLQLYVITNNRTDPATRHDL